MTLESLYPTVIHKGLLLMVFKNFFSPGSCYRYEIYEEGSLVDSGNTYTMEEDRALTIGKNVIDDLLNDEPVKNCAWFAV